MNLRRDKRQNIQLKLDFRATPTGEAQQAATEAAESRPVVHATESPVSTNRLMEEVCGGGTRRFPSTAMAFGRDARLIKQWRRRSDISPQATTGRLIWIWRNFSTESIMTN